MQRSGWLISPVQKQVCPAICSFTAIDKQASTCNAPWRMYLSAGWTQAHWTAASADRSCLTCPSPCDYGRAAALRAAVHPQLLLGRPRCRAFLCIGCSAAALSHLHPTCMFGIILCGLGWRRAQVMPFPSHHALTVDGGVQRMTACCTTCTGRPAENAWCRIVHLHNMHCHCA